MAERINERIKRLRKENNLSVEDIISKLGISRATYYRYENQDVEKLPITILNPLANIFNTTPAYLMGWASDSEGSKNIKNSPTAVKIPVLGYVIAGIPISAIEDIIDYEEISADMAATGEFFCLKVKGDSMEPTFTEGDILVIRQQPDVESNQIAVVIVNGNEGTVKRIKKSSAGITLIGDNVSSFLPVFYTNEEIQQLPVTIVGKVVELRRSF